MSGSRKRPAASTGTAPAPGAAVPPRRALKRRGAARVIAESPAAGAAADADTLVQHPDGWYWSAPDGRQQFGPFETSTLARADRDRYSEEAPDEGETLREAESEVGIADWIDAETGQPAEGQSPPHLEEK